MKRLRPTHLDFLTSLRDHCWENHGSFLVCTDQSKIPRVKGMNVVQWFRTCLASVRIWVQFPHTKNNKRLQNSSGSIILSFKFPSHIPSACSNWMLIQDTARHQKILTAQVTSWQNQQFTNGSRFGPQRPGKAQKESADCLQA